jgi:hypothetical protein
MFLLCCVVEVHALVFAVVEILKCFVVPSGSKTRTNLSLDLVMCVTQSHSKG